MADPIHHAMSSVKKWGGVAEDYLPVHQWFDETKRHFADPRHRAIRHHSQGIGWAIDFFGPTVRLSTCIKCGELMTAEDHALYAPGSGAGGRLLDSERHAFIAKEIPTRWVGEQHVQEDFGHIPNIHDFLRHLQTQEWMVKGARPLSRELEKGERVE